MRRTIFAAMAALAAAGCSREESPAPSEPASLTPAPPEVTAVLAEPAGACGAEANRDWSGYRLQAVAAGEVCQSVTLTLTIVDAAGAAALQEIYAPADLPVLFGEVTTREEMTAALHDWIAPSGGLDTASGLADWPMGAENPTLGEFAFYPAEGMSREEYMAIRAANPPLFCFVQGSESQLCLAQPETKRGVKEVGFQSFPG